MTKLTKAQSKRFYKRFDKVLIFDDYYIDREEAAKFLAKELARQKKEIIEKLEKYIK